MPVAGFETLWAQAQTNDSKLTISEPWNQYMHRDQPIRLNLQGGQKGPKVIVEPPGAGFGPLGPKYGPNLLIESK